MCFWDFASISYILSFIGIIGHSTSLSLETFFDLSCNHSCFISVFSYLNLFSLFLSLGGGFPIQFFQNINSWFVDFYTFFFFNLWGTLTSLILFDGIWIFTSRIYYFFKKNNMDFLRNNSSPASTSHPMLQTILLRWCSNLTIPSHCPHPCQFSLFFFSISLFLFIYFF